jgi:hypothetical protein
MTHPVLIDSLLERYEFPPHDGSPILALGSTNNGKARSWTWGALADSDENIDLHLKARMDWWARVDEFNIDVRIQPL